MSLGSLLRRTLSRIPLANDASMGARQQWDGRRFRRCVVHVGAEKTGTSAIQSFLCRNRDAFAAEGVLYSSSTGADGGSQWAFPAIALPEAWLTDIGLFLNARTQQEMETFIAHFQASFESEIARMSSLDTLVISSEHLQSRLTQPEHIESLKEYLSQYADVIEIVMYIRRQDRMAVSLYSTKIKSGNPNPVLFPKIPHDRLPYYFNFFHMHRSWSQVFGYENVSVRLYDKKEYYGGNLISDFCHVTRLNVEGKSLEDLRVNQSLSIKAAQFLSEVNQQVANIVDGERNGERDFLAHEVARLFPGHYYPALKTEAQAFLERFRHANQMLQEKAFPDRVDGLFDMDFSDYLDSEDAGQPSYADAVEIALALWRASEERNAELIASANPQSQRDQQT